MIVYDPLWKTMQKQNVTIYALRKKHNIGGGTIQRLRNNDTVSTHTLDMLCKILNCSLPDIAEYLPDAPDRE